MKKGNVKPIFVGMILPSVLLRRPRLRHMRRIQHILNKYAVSRCGIVDENVGDSADEFAVLDDGRSAHECGQVGTTVFTKIS